MEPPVALGRKSGPSLRTKISTNTSMNGVLECCRDDNLYRTTPEMEAAAVVEGPVNLQQLPVAELGAEGGSKRTV